MSLHAVPVSLTEANAFVLSFHRHNKPTVGGKFAIGCSNGDALIGVAIVGRPVARHLDECYTAEVARVCVAEGSDKGACSFLYAACWRAWRAMGGRRLVTYTLASESGASLRGAGWKVVGETKPRAKPWHGPDRERDWQPVYGQLKLRWEVNAASLLGSGPTALADGEEEG